jgi:hypothetical protein
MFKKVEDIFLILPLDLKKFINGLQIIDMF